MEAMETVLPAGLQVTSIEPQRSKDGHINVQLRVLGPHDRSVDLVRNLERSRRFLKPRIESESAENSSNSSQQLGPVSATNRFEFELFADYNPPTPEERGALRNVSPTNASSSTGSRVDPASPRQRGRRPYTGPVQLPAHPAHAANGGPQ
jgi:type IV pilus assembly protein PilN